MEEEGYDIRKFFHKWIREAGRGHIAAALSWGLMLIYLAVTLTGLSLNPQYAFFGAGSSELLWISEGWDWPWPRGVFLSAAAKKAGFLLQPAGKERDDILEQIFAWNVPLYDRSGYRDDSLRGISEYGGSGLFQ